MANACRAALLLALTAALAPARGADFDCVTEPRQTIEIRAAVEGLIERVHVDRGDRVKAGQVVATLDAGLERANAELAHFRATMKGALLSGQSRLEYAGIKATRREQLHSERFVSAQDRDEAVTERRLAQSQLLETQDNQQLARLESQRAGEQLRLRTLKTPINGIVVERLMNPGELADNRDLRRPILKVADIDLLHVETLLPLEAHGKIKPGAVAAVFPEAPIGGEYRATVTVVDKVVDPASGTFGVRLDLANPKLEIPAGIKCRVAFPDIVLHKVRQSAAPARAPLLR